MLFKKKREKKPLSKIEQRFDDFIDEECSSGCSLCSKCQKKLRELITYAEKHGKD